MAATTRTFGLILIVLGLASYFLTGRVSVTALIPAFFGAVFVILALVARNESARKHAMHAAVALGLSAPGPGESMSVRLARRRAHHVDAPSVELNGEAWVIAGENDPREPGPVLPDIGPITR